MDRKPLMLLAVLTVVAAALALMLSDDDGKRDASELDAALFPDLLARINSLGAIRVVTADEEVTVRRDGDDWFVDQLGAYPAEFETVKQAAVSVANLRPLEPKTANPARWPMLGVHGPDAVLDPFIKDVATTSSISLTDINGTDLATLIVGKTRPGRPPALYVRRDGEEISWLAAGELRLPAGRVGWVDTQIMNIGPERLGRLIIEHDDGERIAAYRITEDERQWTLADVPAGYEPTFAGVASGLANVLSRLAFEDVRSEALVHWPETGLTTSTYLGFDGLMVTLTSAVVDEETLVRIEVGATDDELASVSFDDLPTPAVLGSPSPHAGAPATEADFIVDDDASSETAIDTSGTTSAALVREALHAEVAALAEAVRGWVYVIPSWKAGSVRKRMDELVTPVEPAEDGASEPFETPVDDSGEVAPSAGNEDSGGN